jgi:hypothetical protein
VAVNDGKLVERTEMGKGYEFASEFTRTNGKKALVRNPGRPPHANFSNCPLVFFGRTLALRQAAGNAAVRKPKQIHEEIRHEKRNET